MPTITELKPRPLSELLGYSPTAADLQKWQAAIEFTSDLIRKDLGLREDPLVVSPKDQNVTLTVSGIVGLLKIRNLTLQVAPKFVSGRVSIARWQASVLNMLAVARRKGFTYSRVDTIGSGRASFIDHIALAYADALDKALRHEAIQTYKTREETSYHLRGALLVERQLQSIVTNPKLLHCRVSYLDTDNPFNQLLHWAGQALLRATFDSSVRRALAATLEKLPDVSSFPTYLLHIPRYLLRQYEHYGEAFDIAVTLARGYGYGQHSGTQPGYGYVLNMEKIFEGLGENSLTARARTTRRPGGCECLPQKSAILAIAASGNCGDYYTRPDNILTIDESAVLLIDAKYKKASSFDVSKHHRPENTDLYQLFASLIAHRCEKALLVYPMMVTDQQEADSELRVWRIRLSEDKAVLIAAMGLDISDLTAPHQLHRIQDQLLAGIEKVLKWPTSSRMVDDLV